ncbi:MAG: 16S rRNA (cytosine(1402)-N(4))-methyltransferase RsmH [Bacteroidota bacterium]
MYHKAVLLDEAVNGLNINPNGTYVDVTYGGGGHSREIINQLSTGRLIAFDQDLDTKKTLIEDERFTLINNNFRFLGTFLRYYSAMPVDGIIADLGVSSHQFDVAERGFSTRFESILDMRMDKRQKLSAFNIINEYQKDKLSEIFWNYGELNNGARISQEIIEYRKSKLITTTEELKEAISKHIDKRNEAKFMAKVFQALRIEVNQELDVLKEMLWQSLKVLKTGGRLVVISYHSLEDRIVKNFMKSGNFDGALEKDLYGNCKVPFKMIVKKPIVPTEKEIKDNNRARSAKLRIAEKI